MSKYEEVTQALYDKFDSQLYDVIYRGYNSRREIRKLETIAKKCLARITPDNGNSIRLEMQKLRK